MKIVSNDKLIKRNGRIGNITSLLSIAVLGVGMFFSFKDQDGSLLPYTFGSLIVGFLMFQVGNYYMTKWGKSPRPDERLSTALKGLDDKYTLYHYMTPVSHLLVGPAGVTCLIPLHQAGTISYDSNRNRWKQSGGNFFMKTFGGESLGRPENEARYSVEDATKFISQNEIRLTPFVPEALLVFTNEKATIIADESPIAAVQAARLKEYLRKKVKEKPMSLDMIKEVENKITV